MNTQTIFSNESIKQRLIAPLLAQAAKGEQAEQLITATVYTILFSRFTSALSERFPEIEGLFSGEKEAASIEDVTAMLAQFKEKGISQEVLTGILEEIITDLEKKFSR